MTDWVDETNLTDALIAIDKPTKRVQGRNLRDRDLYLRETAMRGGGWDTGSVWSSIRYVHACGSRPFSVTTTNTINWESDLVIDMTTYGSTHFDGSLGPRFLSTGYLHPFLTVEEDTSGSGVAWEANGIFVVAHVLNGFDHDTMSVKVMIYNDTPGSELVEGIVHVHVFGQPYGSE